MKRITAKSNKDQNKLGKFIPGVIVGLLIIVSYFVLFRSGFVFMPTAQAQVNIQKVGEAAIPKEAGKSSIDQAGGELTGETPAQTEPAAPSGETQEPQPQGEEVTGTEEEMPAGETAEQPKMVPVNPDATQPGGKFYMSSEGLGGKPITQLTADELKQELLEMPQLGGSEEALEILLPILRRFQLMVGAQWTPPEDVDKDDYKPPWESTSRRYSPFDPVGSGQREARPNIKPIPPFPPIEGLGEVKKEGPSAEDVAKRTRLKGIVGEEGAYRAILSAEGKQGQFGVGDVITTIGNASFVITDITMNGVRIQNQSKTGDQALILFVEREGSGIEGFSIAY